MDPAACLDFPTNACFSLHGCGYIYFLLAFFFSFGLTVKSAAKTLGARRARESCPECLKRKSPRHPAHSNALLGSQHRFENSVMPVSGIYVLRVSFSLLLPLEVLIRSE